MLLKWIIYQLQCNRLRLVDDGGGFFLEEGSGGGVLEMGKWYYGFAGIKIREGKADRWIEIVWKRGEDNFFFSLLILFLGGWRGMYLVNFLWFFSPNGMFKNFNGFWKLETIVKIRSIFLIESNFIHFRNFKNFVKLEIVINFMKFY